VELADLVLWAVLLLVFGYLVAVVWAMARIVGRETRERRDRAEH
jgi:Na+-transporting methylmalonyl-CoA/oxaloacetate decarboxylase gamma subunit